ncbi:MAG: hypothetical protein KAS32_13920 [Candidatus Peribacteraceae bacterium]|nr:hypothetical protein [Candidatus Peribacteraceae bacterium]
MVDMIHVGLHKTGTSWLQYEVFPRISKQIISNELFSGRPFRLTIDDIIDTNERFHYAEILRKTFGDVKILVGLREKDSLVASLYSQYLKGGGAVNFDIWKDTQLNRKYLDYDSYTAYLKKLFSDVKVYWYEEMNENKKLFIEELCTWLGCDVPDYNDYVINKGLTKYQKKRYWIKNNIKQMKIDFRRLLE